MFKLCKLSNGTKGNTLLLFELQVQQSRQHESFLLVLFESCEEIFFDHANHEGSDSPAHSCSLISSFVFCCLDSIISILAESKISRLQLV